MTAPSDKPKLSPLAVSSDDFIRFLESISINDQCPVCETDRWTIICTPEDEETPETKYAYRAVAPLRDGPKPMNLSSFSLYCNNCGYLRQHVAKVVRAWVRENPIDPELEFGEGGEEGQDDDR